MKNLMRHSTIMLAALMLAACAQLGIPTAQNFDEKALAVQLVVVEVRTTNAALLDAKKISSADAINVRKGADIAQEGIDVAREIAKIDIATAEGKLTAVRTGLTAISTYLASRK